MIHASCKQVSGLRHRLCRKRGRDNGGLQANSISRHNSTDTYTNSQILAVHTRHVQVQSRQDPITEWGKWTCGSTPHQEAIWNWYQLAKGKSVCFNGFLYINQTQGKISYPRISSQHKTNSMVVCFLLFHFVLFEHFCLIWVFCLFVFGFSFLFFWVIFWIWFVWAFFPFLKTKNIKIGCGRRWGRPGRSWARENHDQNIL